MKQEHENKENQNAFPLRLPPELKTAMTEIARHEKRSLNTQIVFVLENFVKSSEINAPVKLAV